MKYLISIAISFIFLLPGNIFAACSDDGYSVVYVNGINTKSEKDTKNDTDILSDNFSWYSNLKNVQFFPAYNPSHLAGVGDIAETISQIYNNPVSDYDLKTILLKLYPEITTRKILLVGHSQGTFYTNEIYDYLINNGVPKESMAVYNVATPASFVSGNGGYLTSSNDKVINLVRSIAPKVNAELPLPANITIPLNSQESADLFGGHSFSGVYLANESLRIVSDIESGLKKLSIAGANSSSDAGCFIPPEKNISYYAQESVFSVADAAINGAIMASNGISNVGEVVYGGTVAAVAQVVSMAKGVLTTVTGTMKDSAQISDQKLLAEVSLNSISSQSIDQGVQENINTESAVQPIQSDLASTDKNISDTNVETVNTPEQLIVENVDENLKQKDTQSTESVISTSTKEQLADTKIAPDNIKSQDVQICSFNTTKTATHQNLIINEVAWMGSQRSANDEWIELKNISNSEFDISGWQILDKGEQIKITIPAGTKISAGGFLLMERTDDNSVPGVGADIIYTGALSNSAEGLRLFDNQCNLVDDVLAGGEWPAGDVATKKTMERQADLTWSTYNGAGQGSGDLLILGTPKKENSIKIISYTGGSSAVIDNKQPVSDTQQNPDKILITEVQITGGTGKSSNDFVELYNPNNTRVNLKGYRLVKRTETGSSDISIKSWTDDAYIEPRGFYVWANSNYAELLSLANVTTSATLANNNSIALRYGAENTGNVIDAVGWGGAANSFIGQNSFSQNPGANQSIQRKIQNDGFINSGDNSSDFELTSCPNPGAQSEYCAISETSKSNEAPSAFFVFSPSAPEAGEEISFDAASTTDADGNITLYDWNFGDGQGAGSTQATTTHSYSSAGNYNVFLTVFDSLNASSTYTLPISVASSSLHQSNHILISEVMPGLDNGRADEEFIELYNPTSEDVNLANYSLKRKSSILSTTTQALVNADNFSGTTIKSRGFLLIASREYQGSSTPDIYYSNTTHHLAYDDDAVILYDANGIAIDEVDYENIGAGKSLERNALSGGVCVSSYGDGEFLGNGCDTNNPSDFELRDISNPQNLNNFPEPRNNPANINNFSAQYDRSNKKIILNWDGSYDYAGSTTTLSYLISDVSDVPVIANATTSSTTAEFKVIEIGRDYNFAIKALDKEGLFSEISTVVVSVPSISIADANYFILDQSNLLGSSENPGGQVFKPIAAGVVNSVTMKIINSANYGDLQGIADVNVALYEWVGNDIAASPDFGMGKLLATSPSKTFYANYSGDYTWIFDPQNQIAVDSSKYYYLQINVSHTHGDLHISWGLASASDAQSKSLYVIIKANQEGAISLSDSINNYVFQDISVNLQGNYLEPENNKYNSVYVKIKDFYTGEVVSDKTISLTSDEQSIGWHAIAGGLNISRPGYFKIIVSLSDSIKTESNFSVFGAPPPESELLYQNAFGDFGISSNHFSGQVFRPAASGKIDSLTLEVTSGDPNIVQAHSYWSIYEWAGNGNDLAGSAGALLATTTSKFLIASTYYPGPVKETWDFDGDNEIYLDSGKYYYLTLSIVPDNTTCTFDCRPAMLYMAGSSNGSLIDGRLINDLNNTGDLYLILNKKI
jgi:hypothetical protein